MSPKCTIDDRFLANLATEGYGARGSPKNENGTHFHKRPVL